MPSVDTKLELYGGLYMKKRLLIKNKLVEKIRIIKTKQKNV